MDALVKSLSSAYPTLEIVFLRFAFTVLFVGSLAAMSGNAAPSRRQLGAHLGRAVLIVVANSSFFYALGRLPLAEVFALSMTAPVFMALFGAIFLKEPVRLSIAAAIAVGFAGMIVIVFGAGRASISTQADLLAVLCALLAPVSYALSVVLLRAQTAHEPITIIISVQALLVVLLLVPAVAVEFVPPRPADWLAFAAVGLLGSSGYLAFASALKRLSAARYSVTEYTGLIWAALFGYLFFAETPRPALWLGAALIIAGCAIVARQRGAPAPS
jgi:S-adenosylmethionine uptake transporter